ncbi:hypothetical protein [Geminocystis sp. NIES-3709]|uniref:hypothetical protein n=1 Tax=Geminocystis sp. NIES-3709 TaxID=1617448 RepID=UPI0005FCD4AC|nr:hypothetical protein [Geminocystis sp. NIES-3709]BAQ66278.1 hypothetical protein GM3709_3043 [Geminocystis sp. NIES-3709]
MNINWHKLAEIKELKPYFENDFNKFQEKIENYLIIWSEINSEDLDKLALLRALEVTNGCTQWAYRRGDQECLSIDQTRECMKLSMGSIKNKKILLKDGKVILFSSEMENLIQEGRELYISAFKENLPEKEEEFYALSTCQFLTYGQNRMDKSFDIIQDNYGHLFTDFFINKGKRYVQPYLDAI